jgi:ribosome-associated protein
MPAPLISALPLVDSPMLTLSSRELTLHAVRLALDKGGDDVLVLELPKNHGAFDFCVLVTGRSDRQVHAIASEIYHFCKRHKIPHLPVEGESGWMLIDCIDLVVHTFSEEKRALYRLDRLWPLAREMKYEKELKALVDPDSKAKAAAE